MFGQFLGGWVPPLSDGFPWSNKSEPDTSKKYFLDEMAEERERCALCGAFLKPDGPSTFWCHEDHFRMWVAKQHEERSQ